MGAFDDLLPKKGGTFDDLIPDYGRTLKENEVTAAGETALSKMISPLASVIPQGYRNLAEVGNEAYQSTFGDKRDFSLGDALERGHSTGEALTYEPRTETGKLAAGRFDDLYEKGRELGRTNVDWMIRAGGVPDDIADVIEKKTSPITQTLGEQIFDLTAGAAMGKLLPIPGARKASPYDGLRKSHKELAGKTDAEIIDFLEKSRTDTQVPLEQRTQGELFDVTPPEGQLGTTNPMIDAMERAKGELRSIEESDAFGRQELSGGQKELFPETTGLEKIDNGLEQPNTRVSSPIVEPDGLSKGVEYGFEKNREGIQGTNVPDATRPELRLQDYSEYSNALPYRNTIHEYIYQRFPELTEKLQKDAVVQRLMTEVDKWTDHLKATLDMGGSEFAAGMRIKNKNIKLMPGVRVEAGKELGSTKRSQAELNRLKAEYERSAQQLDVVVGQLSNRLKSRSKAIGSDIADNAKFSDWINDRLNSKGPEEGSIYTKGTYKEGSASANIVKTETPPLGQTKIGGSQRGGPKMEDPFKKFEKSLPTPYKPFAKQMWKELEAKKENPSFIENKEAIAVDKVLNKTVGGVNAYTRLVTPWGKEVKELLLSPGKDMPGTKFTRPAADLLTAGGNLRAFETRDPRIKYAVDNIRTAKKNVEIVTHKKLFDEGGIIYAWERLTTKEQIALKSVIDRFKGKEDLSAARLREEGMNGNQIYAYEAERRHFDATFYELEAERAASKQAPIPRQPGYSPSSWSGDYFFEVRKRHPDGRLELVDIETGNWKGIGGKMGLAGIRERMMLEQGDVFEFGPIEQRGRKGSNKQTQEVFNQLVDLLRKENPDRAVLDRVIEKYNEEIADSTRNFREHFKVSHGVSGYKGNKFGVSDAQSVKDRLYAIEGYFNDAHEYLETKRAARNVNGMLFDPEIRAQAPNALNYVRQYWDQARGVEPMLARVIDYIPEKMAESVGLSRYAPKNAVQELRAKMMLFFLGFNRSVFLLAQRVQSFQFSIPTLAKMQTELGLEGFQSSLGVASTKGYYDHSMAMVSPEKMSKLGKEALDYAVANRVVETSFLDGVRSASTMNAHRMAKFLTGETLLRWADKSSRMDAYLQFVHLLDQSGLKGPELFKAAEDAMLRAMVDYTQHERPLIYKQFGLIGDLASPLTTFKHNYYSQLYMYGKDALKHPTNPAYTKAILAFLTTQYIMGGYMGLPGVQDFDWIIDTARAHGLVDPRTPNVTQAMARWSSGLQETKRNFLRYGAFAGMTGMDISPTFSAAALIPDQGLTGIFPVPMKAGEIAYNAANVAAGELGRLGGGQGSTMVDRANLLKEGTPSALKVIPEMLNQNKRTGMIPNPKEHMAGDMRRGPPSITDPDWVASALGTSTIKESEQRTAAYQSKLQEEAIKAQKQKLIAKGKDLRVSGKGYSKEAAEYVELGGTMNEFVNALKDNDMAQNRTRLERQKGIPKTLGQAQKYKRLEEYGITK